MTIFLLALSTSHVCAKSESDRCFYHNNHLGSAAWITEGGGKPVQYMHYLPYGQLLANQTPGWYDERFKFIGKERDEESGYDFFGARYYISPFLHWMSVDPLVDKYPNISPYAYCGWNPVKYVDPDGQDVRTGTPGFEDEGVWISAQNTTYQHPQSSYDAHQMPYGEYFHNQGQLNQGTLQSTFTKESYLQNMPEQDRALVTNPVIQVAAVSVLGAGAISMLNEALPAVVSAGADASTYMNTTLYSAFEGSVPLQIGARTVEGIIKGVTSGTELTPNLYNSPAYQVGSDLGNSSMFVLKEIRDFFNPSNKK